MHLSENNSYPASDEIWVVLLVFHDVDPVEDQVVLPGLRIHDDDIRMMIMLKIMLKIMVMIMVRMIIP